ncbi:MAG: hypothetical protein AAB914_00635 [Patescibacteria group bacterium]
MDIAKLNPKDFEEIIWSRPENNRQASQLVILGGSKDHFAITSKIYMAMSGTKGIKLSLLLPNYLSKLVGNKDSNIIFIDSHKPGGYFFKDSVNEVANIINDADLCLVAGEMGKSNETQQFIENVMEHSSSQIVITQSAVECFAENYLPKLLAKGNVTLCIDGLTMSKLGKSIKFEKAFISSLGFAQKIEYLELLTKKYSCSVVISDENTIWMGKTGNVFYSKSPKSLKNIVVDISSWLSWNNKDPLKTITSTF